MPDKLTLADFAPHTGTVFNVTGSLQIASELELIEANDRSGPPVQGMTHECFSLLFRGPLEPALAQGTYDLDHGVMGSLPLFLVPIASVDPTVRCYEAVFNRYC